uniref:Epidermal growth factor receptor kinase substrate 8-like protein 2 n=1 Tax=Lygus hesperus TaxID=30085 RepID=A0A0A9WRZ1_LYGHE
MERKVAPYRPVFMDGWSPDYAVTDEIEDRRVEPISNSISPSGKNMRGDDLRTSQHEIDLRESHYQRERDRQDSHYSSDYFEYDRQPPSPTDPRYSYERNYPGREDRYSRDERIDSTSPGESESGPPPPPRSDISVDSIERTGGLISGGEKFERTQAKWLEELRSSGAKVVQVTYPRTANNDKELSVVRGEFLQVLDDSRKWWKARNSRGEVAHVPHTIVTPYQPTEHGDVFGTSYGRGYYPSQDERSGRPGGIPAPPPAPPVQPAPATAEWVRKERLASQASSTSAGEEKDRMFAELKDALSVMHNRQPLIMKKKNNVFIDADSSKAEVQHWLKEKGFDERLCALLKDLDGKEIFQLTTGHLERVCGTKEGKRLFNQLMLQRNISKYQTTRGSELMAKLQQRRMKSEPELKGENGQSNGNGLHDAKI